MIIRAIASSKLSLQLRFTGEDGLCLRRFKDNRDNRDNFFPCLQAGTGRRNGLYLLSLLSFKKKTRGRKTTLLFCFLFSVSCVFYITGFFQLYFIYWLFPIRLVLSNCILYIGFSQLYWFFPIVFYILAFPNYIGFSQLYFIYWLYPIILSFSPII